MSGGVDSSVSVALLKEQGFDVSGVYLKLWEGKDDADRHMSLGDPCWVNEMRDATRVAAHLDIPFTVWDVTERYKKRVLENFYQEYDAGRTPNPDVLCNSEIKFGIAYDRAMELGYDFVATGHYAQIMQNEKCKIKNELHAGADSNKDQSYFLWRLKQEQLAHILFPIGKYEKPHVRELAQKFGLHNAEKKDSQGVCFLGKIDLKEFLYKPRGNASVNTETLPLGFSATRMPGAIIDVHGKKLGTHDGLAHFTIGQREGMRLGGTGPYFVVMKDIKNNALIVAHESEAAQYFAKSCTVRDVNWINDAPQDNIRLMARPRYRAELSYVILRRLAERSSSSKIFRDYIQNDKEGLHVVFSNPSSFVAPGQSIVFYDGERVVGGGVIDTVELVNIPAVA